jgi:transcriptional antiterminator Rof (Rho-off)
MTHHVREIYTPHFLVNSDYYDYLRIICMHRKAIHACHHFIIYYYY